MSTISKEWKLFLKKIIEEGSWVEKDDGDNIKESLINYCFIENPLNKYEPMNITSEFFLELIKKGEFDIEDYPLKGSALADYVDSFNDENIIHLTERKKGDNQFIYNYPERIQAIKLSDREGNVNFYNQYEIIKRRLIEHRESNRGVATTYSAGLDESEQHIPCLQIIQATIRNNELILHVYFRSNDCYGAFPSNMLFLSYIGIRLVEDLKNYYPTLKFKGISYSSSSLHIYKGDIEQVEELIK